MKIYYVLFLLVFAFSTTFAQKNNKPVTSSSEKKLTVEISTSTQKKDESLKQVNSNSLKKDEKNLEDEPSEVLLDKMEDESYQQYQYTEEERKEEPPSLNKIPFSYGTFKGVFNDGQKSLLVFEDENGTISFIQIYFERNKIRWKLLYQIERS